MSDMSQPDINNHSRPTSSSSFHHRIINDDDDNVVDQRVSTMTSPTSVKRYATYELNWSNFNHDLDQNNDNSAQAARWSLPNSPPPTNPIPQNQQQQQQQKKQQRPSKVRKSISPIIINTRKSDKNDDEPQSPFGGITVTTVKVVEILHSPTEKDPSRLNDDIKSKKRISRPEPSEDPVGIITSESSKDRKHSKQRINLSLPSSNSVPRPSPSSSQKDPKMLKQKKRSSLINSQKIKGNKSLKKPELIIPKEMAFIDPRLLAINKSLVKTPLIPTTTTNRNRKTIRRGGSFYRTKVPPKNLEFGSTSNPIYSNDPTDMEADLPPIKNKIFPWLPGSLKPPQLLHASLVPLPRVNRGTINNHDSDNILDNSDSLLTSINPKRKSKINSNRLSRVNSQRRRTSTIEPDPNRASLIFRRQILEESLMMSFGGMMMNGAQQQPTSISKPPIRRKTRKVSNAKLEDREVRRERRRRERLEKKLAKEASNNNDKMGGKDNVKEFYMGPQPPPRKQSQDKPTIPSPQKPKNNTSPLLSSPPDRRLGNSNVNSSLEHSTDEPPPFPTHLALFEHNSNKERSKLKKQQYSPSKGQPISSPISNNSRVITSNSEGKEGKELNDDDLSDETSSINQLPSPIKSQKIGKNILGLFNKQTTKDSTSPSISQISSPILRPAQLSLQSPPTTPTTPTTLSSSTTPPQTPPLSPRTLKVPQQLFGKSRNGIENGIGNQNQGKKKKMEQFEALISETSSSKKPISGKIRAITTAITTVASSATSSASSSISIRKKSADGTPYNSPRHSSEGSYKSESEKKNGLKRDSSNRGSLTSSLADSVRYRPDGSELGPGDDGVIRVTLTPEVCR